VTSHDTVTKRALVPTLALAAIAVSPIGCGSNGSGGPGGPTPPTLPVATRAFVHVLGPLGKSQGTVPGQAPLSTFEVTPPSGLLRPIASLLIDEATGVGADPQGRFVYVGGRKGKPGYLRTYAVDGATGLLSARSEILLPKLGGSDPPTCSPTPLAATEGEVFVRHSCQGDAYEFLVYLSDAGGVLSEGPRPYADFDDEADWLVPLPSTRIVYADCASYPSDGIAVMSPRPDGRLENVGLVPTLGSYGRARDAALTEGCLVAVWRSATSGGITSHRVDGSTGMPTAVSTLSGFIPIHVAAGAGGHVAVTTASALMPYSLTSSCDLVPRQTLPFSVTVSGDQPDAGSLAFHPSGRFAYVDGDAGLQVCAVLDSGDLQVIETHSSVRGRVAVAPPP
jgi:hypothetical protein